MEFIIALAMKFWQWTLVIVFILIGWLINVLDKRKPPKVEFTYKEFPHMQPLKISKILCEEGHAVAYFGGSKKNIQAKHMKNRQKLVKRGIVKGPIE